MRILVVHALRLCQRANTSRSPRIAFLKQFITKLLVDAGVGAHFQVGVFVQVSARTRTLKLLSKRLHRHRRTQRCFVLRRDHDVMFMVMLVLVLKTKTVVFDAVSI